MNCKHCDIPITLKRPLSGEPYWVHMEGMTLCHFLTAEPED